MINTQISTISYSQEHLPVTFFLRCSFQARLCGERGLTPMGLFARAWGRKHLGMVANEWHILLPETKYLMNSYNYIDKQRNWPLGGVQLLRLFQAYSTKHSPQLLVRGLIDQNNLFCALDCCSWIKVWFELPFEVIHTSERCYWRSFHDWHNLFLVVL